VLPAQEVLQATVYSDGLGRDVQAVTNSIGPALAMTGTATTYDAYGRPNRYCLHLQRAIAGDAVNDGNFKLDAF